MRRAQRLKESLDEMFAEPIEPALQPRRRREQAVRHRFGGYVVGSHEFYMGYAIQQADKLLCLDAGHFHPTETIADKMSALSLFIDGILLHVSRGDALGQRPCGHARRRAAGDRPGDRARRLLDRVHIGLDFFDASINRVAAWVIGTRNTLKALLRAMLEPTEALRQAELEGDYTTRLALTEEFKTYPFGAVWDYYCAKMGVPVREAWLAEVQAVRAGSAGKAQRIMRGAMHERYWRLISAQAAAGRCSAGSTDRRITAEEIHRFPNDPVRWAAGCIGIFCGLTMKSSRAC